MTGGNGTDAQEGDDPEVTCRDDPVTVDWDVRMRRCLRQVGLEESVAGRVDVLVVDRRGGETTPPEPGELRVDGHRVVVVPDRTDGAPAVRIRVAGGRERYGAAVRTLRRTVALDASVDAAFESARRRYRRRHGNGGFTTDGGRPTPSVESAVRGFDDADTSLAVGGFAAAVEPLRRHRDLDPPR